MRKSDLSDQDLCKAVSEMEQGLIDAHLGGYVVKKRVALAGRGKRGGARTLVATNLEDRCFFLFGFEKPSAQTLPTMSCEYFRKRPGIYSGSTIRK
jgi:hypothetical protein